MGHETRTAEVTPMCPLEQNQQSHSEKAPTYPAAKHGLRSASRVASSKTALVTLVRSFGDGPQVLSWGSPLPHPVTL